MTFRKIVPNVILFHEKSKLGHTFFEGQQSTKPLISIGVRGSGSNETKLTTTLSKEIMLEIREEGGDPIEERHLALKFDVFLSVVNFSMEQWAKSPEGFCPEGNKMRFFLRNRKNSGATLQNLR